MITFVFRVIWNSNIFIANREQPKFLWFIHKFWSWVQILFRIEKVRSLMKLAKEPKNAFLGRNFLDARFGRQTLFDHHRLYASMHAINTTKEHLNMNNVTTWASWNLSINVSKHHKISVFTFNGLRHENEKEIWWRNWRKIPANPCISVQNGLEFTDLNVSLVASSCPYPWKIAGCCVHDMNIGSIRWISMGNKYHSHWHSTLSNSSYWLVPLWANSQHRKVVAIVVMMTKISEINSIGLVVGSFYARNEN